MLAPIHAGRETGRRDNGVETRRGCGSGKDFGVPGRESAPTRPGAATAAWAGRRLVRPIVTWQLRCVGGCAPVFEMTGARILITSPGNIAEHNRL